MAVYFIQAGEDGSIKIGYRLSGEWFSPSPEVWEVVGSAEKWTQKPRRRRRGRPKNNAGLEAALEAMGGVSAGAELLGISHPSLSSWRRVPAERVIQIERLVGGRVSRHDMRPDLYPESAPA